MPKRVALTSLNGRTIDILNTIRANASYEYQQTIPAVANEEDIPRVGELLMGYPNLANQFVNALINRIALVRVKSATFNNAYAELKKGFLEFGETVEEVFVNIAKAREFSAEKAEARELKRSLPDVRSAFHTLNWRAQYPVTIQNEDLRQAFLSFSGVEDLIARIVDSVYTAAEYDEYLLFKYLIIKGISHGKMHPESFDGSVARNAAVAFRGMSNKLTFMGTQYNAAGVHTSTPRSDQYIFMDSQFNAQFDVDVLSAAFNMDRADFMGRLMLIDSFTTFDNDRFDIIRGESNMIELVTEEELAIMANVKAIIVDREWFQVYDNLATMSEKYVAAGLYWNYFYNAWKTISWSPFSNAVVFVDSATAIVEPTVVEVEIETKSVTDGGTAVYTLSVDDDTATLSNMVVKFEQNATATAAGIAVHPYGGVIVPEGESYTPTATIGGTAYTAVTTAAGTTSFVLGDAADVGTVFYLVKPQS